MHSGPCVTRLGASRPRVWRVRHIRPDGRRRERGLSIIESLVVLLVSSLLLSILLPTAIQSLSANLRIGDVGLQQLRRSLDERGFRKMMSAATPARQAPGARPVRETVRGDARQMTLTVIAREAVACAPESREVRVKLMIEDAEGGDGGRLVCRGEGAEAQDSVVATWRRGRGAFAYSLDGLQWRADWPDPELIAAQENAVRDADDTSGLTQPLVLAPLVRLEIKDATQTTVWVERAGAVEPVQVRLDGELLTSRSPLSP